MKKKCNGNLEYIPVSGNTHSAIGLNDNTNDSHP